MRLPVLLAPFQDAIASLFPRDALASLLALVVTAAPVSAACEAPSFLDRLAPTEIAELDAAAAAIPYGQGLLWEATKGDARVVIVGTLHVSDPRHEALVERVRPEIEAADRLLVEITHEDQAAMARAILDDPTMMYLSDGPALPDRLDPELWASVAEAARARSIPPFMAAKFRPWSLMITLSIPPCALEQVGDSEGGLDFRLMAVAEEAGVPQASLEPYDTIVQLFDAAGEEAEIELLRTALVSPELQAEMYVATVDDYFAGRTARSWLLGTSAIEAVPGLDAGDVERLSALMTDLLLTERNAAWIPVIEAAAGTGGSVVAAFGAAHLPGDGGVPALLEAAGWTIRPLT